MRNLRKIILPAICLLLCIGVALLWARSGETVDCIDYTHVSPARATLISGYSWRGQLVLEIRTEPPSDWTRTYAGLARRAFPAAHVWTSQYLAATKEESSVGVLGFWYGQRQFLDDSGRGQPVPATARLFAVPDAFVILLAILLPIVWVRRKLVHDARAAAGKCLHCGYDLRASTGRCPECGKPIGPVSSGRIVILAAVRMEAIAIARRLALRGSADGTWVSKDRSPSIELHTIGLRAIRRPDLLKKETARCIILAGLGGGLDPQLKVGDVVVDDCPEEWRKAITAHFGAIHCSDRMISTPAAKGKLFAKTRALAVDMESGIARLWAAEAELPFISVRAISDAAGDLLDPAVLRFVDPLGRIRPIALMSGLLRRPWLLPRLLRLGRDSRRACAALADVVQSLVQQIGPRAEYLKATSSQVQ